MLSCSLIPVSCPSHLIASDALSMMTLSDRHDAITMGKKKRTANLVKIRHHLFLKSIVKSTALTKSFFRRIRIIHFFIVILFLLPQNYEKKGFVPKKRSSNISHFCKQLHFCHLKPSKETLLTFILMASISCTVLCESKCVGMLRCALLDDHLFAADDVDAWGQGACFGGVVCHFHAVEVVDGLAEFV